MLHEILLSLSGYPSQLFDSQRVGDASHHVTSSPLALLSPPEAELLSSIGHLSRLHRRIRDHVATIASAHPSTICRAVATAISSRHLAAFQKKILEVEHSILKQDATAVGAYNIVPLAGLVGEFSEWTRLMEWLWDISKSMMDSAPVAKGSKGASAMSGAEIIDKLRTEAQTGYPDIEQAALHLGTVAETSWLRQLSSWLLYGRLPAFGASDFFISADDEEDLSFVVNHRLLPKFVTRQTASSILFIGKSLNQIRSLNSPSKSMRQTSPRNFELELLPTHVERLSEVSAPIASAKLSGAVAQIRLSLSRNLLQHLLPLEKIVEILTVLHEFFLLGRGEFAMALITEADEKLQSRHRSTIPTKPGQGIQGILLKETEINNTLARVWTTLSSLGGEDDHGDEALELATDMIHLIVRAPSGHRPGTPGRARESNVMLPMIADVTFGDLLLSVPISLTMDIHSPFDLFMTKADLDVYSSVNAYLLALRRAHLHLAHLWRHSSIRREHPAPPGYQYSNSEHGKAVLNRRRQRSNARTRDMRPIWATCSAAIFLLAESEAYFQGEVVQGSFKHFLRWVIGSDESQTTSDGSTSHSISAISGMTEELSLSAKQHHDPEALSFAHRQFLGSISYSLLLTDHGFTKTIRGFFTHVDELVAYISRLQIIRQNLDLEEDDGVEDFMANYAQEEKHVARELDRARKRLDSDMKSLIARLRDIDSERLGSGPASGLTNYNEDKQYEPLRVGGVDRLLMKLDWGGTEEEDDDNDLL
jgi:hypothetical protein